MKTTTPILRSSRRRTAAAFTLTEILIALALVAVLLIGISRIFAITSQTISVGQALSKAVRTQKAIQQTISADIVGVLPTSANLRPYSGMTPVNAAGDANAGMPFLQICNFRTPTYLTRQAMLDDSTPPADDTSMNATKFATRSLLIRGADLNHDGVDSKTSIASAGGEMTPLFFYGDRNFRCDTVGFFSRGKYRSQTGVSGSIPDVFGAAAVNGASSLQSDLESSDAFIWYGQMRVFNSEGAQYDRAAGFGNPGDWLTSGPGPNRNNRFANQFILGRMQYLLAEPTDHDQRWGSYPPINPTTATPSELDRKKAEEYTVTAANDPSKPVIFIQRQWWDPNQHLIDPNTAVPDKTRPFFSPFRYQDSVVYYQRDSATATTGRNRQLYANETTNSSGTGNINYQPFNGRTDVAGLGIKSARQRARFLEQYDIDFPPLVSKNQQWWWEPMFTSWNRRSWVNPFVSTTALSPNEPNLNAKTMAQRQQLLSDGVSQFIVEFAGDFLTQDQTAGNNFGVVTAITPDGILDFVAVPVGSNGPTGAAGYRTVTRWYGLPRDIDGNGLIPATAATARTSVDVLPVSRVVPPALFTDPVIKWMPFERTVNAASPVEPSMPAVSGDYAKNLDEPANATDPARSGYICVWGPREFERQYDLEPPSPPGVTHVPNFIHGGYPSLLRFVIDVVDQDGKLSQPVTQELVFRVPDESVQQSN